MKTFILIILFFLNFNGLFAQDKADLKHFEKQLSFAKELIFYENYKPAYNSLLEIYWMDSLNPELNYYTGLAAFNALRNKEIAFPYLKKGLSYNGNAYFLLGVIYRQKEMFEDAIQSFNQYKSLIHTHKLYDLKLVNKELSFINTAKKLKEEHQALNVQNLGAVINSPYPDYAPVLFANGYKMYFTSRREGLYPKEKDPNDEYFEDIYYTEKVNGKWEKPMNIGAPINTKTHDAAIGLSKDEKTLYFYRTSPSVISGNILLSKKDSNNIWSKPSLFEASINSKNSVESSLCIHPDGNTIYFSSNREGGYGGKDIYYITKLPNNKWSLPTNLGAMINTELDEDGPFINADGTLLYFSSKGHENMGGYDLFVSHLLEDEETWSEPENLGYPINSVKDDIFLYTVNNIDFFFSSNRQGGYGSADIYHTFIPKEENQYFIIKGNAIGFTSIAPLPVNITVFNQTTNKLEGIYKSNRMGKFVIILKTGEVYKMFVESDGYYSYIDKIDLTQNISVKDVRKIIKMHKIDVAK